MIITRTPLRISLAGDGTDVGYYKIYGGAVVNVTISKYVYVTVNKNFDNRVQISTIKTELADRTENKQEDIVKECLRLTGVDSGVSIMINADVPAGRNLGYYGSLIVGLLNALYAYKGYTLSSKELAEKACTINGAIFNNLVGKQDVYAAAYGGLNYFQFNMDETVECYDIKLLDTDERHMNQSLLMFYLENHQKADGLKTKVLWEKQEKLNSLHFMKNQAFKMCFQLKEGYNNHFSTLLHESWIKQRMVMGTVNDIIDDIYKTGLLSGAAGGKQPDTGGSFLLFYCENEKQQSVRNALKLKNIDFRITKYGSRIVYYC